MNKKHILFLFILFKSCSQLAKNTLSRAMINLVQVSIYDFVKKFPKTSLIQCTKDYQVNYPPFPLYQEKVGECFPHKNLLKDIYIMKVPQAIAYFHKAYYGNTFVSINNCFIEQMQIKNFTLFKKGNSVVMPINNSIKKVAGRVAIIHHLVPNIYGHWIIDVLSQLALLEQYDIKYDYLCVPYYTKFMQESLTLLNIDHQKIIPLQLGTGIQADTIIIPTAVSQERNLVSNVNYHVDFLLQHIRHRMLQGIADLENQEGCCEKVFISRKDASGKRAVPNEDEVFALFEPLGFKRYELYSLSMQEQIRLFYHAKTVVSFVGSGSTNILYCKPGTRYVELVQKMVDATFFFIADTCNLQYRCIDDSTVDDLPFQNPWVNLTPFDLKKVKDFIEKNPDL